METQNTQLKPAGPRITSTSAGLLIRLSTYRSAVLAFLFAGATLLSTPAASANTITVVNTNDSGPGSVRQALIDANDGDTIDFDSSLSGQRITLTTGQLDVNKDVTISGPGAKNLAVDGNAHSRVFYVNPGKIVTIDGLTVANGYSSGEGAGIFNDAGALAVTNCVLNRNSAADGGGIASDGNNGNAKLTVTNCNISGNLAAGGGGISNFAYIHDATLTVTNSTISDNSADYDGGDGIGNVAVGANATLTITNSTITGNGSLASSPGGGISNYAGAGSATLTITNSTVSGNSAGDGGGISNYTGAGSATLTITNSTISGNSSYEGGGIFNDAYQGVATVTIANSTISGNSAVDGGGVSGLAGSAFSIGDSIVAVSNSTISGNSATGHAAAIFNYAYAGFAAVETGNTIFDAGSSGENIFNYAGTVTSLGYNLSSDNGGGYLTDPGDQINTDPVLGPLQDNGGPTFTHALSPSSPAVNSGNPNAPARDQRYYLRNGSPDKGAFEYGGALAPLNSVSRKIHGAAGAFDIDLPLSGNSAIECRSGGANADHQMIMTFASPVTIAGASVTSGVGTVNDASVNGSQVTVNLTGVANAQRIVLTLAGVSDGANTNNVNLPMGVLLGDTNANGRVNASDASQTKGRIGQTLDATNFRSDVNANGAVNGTDAAIIKVNIGTGLP